MEGSYFQTSEKYQPKGLSYGNGNNPKFGYTSLTVLYPPLSKVKADNLTVEIFYELINKTDYLLRKLVESLEIKLQQEKKVI